MPTGVYVSVPFCRTKCSYCNFASDVFSRAVFQRYVDRVCSDIERTAETAELMGASFDPAIDSIYLGGGTPTVLDGTQLRQLFVTISQNFQVLPGAEITVECAPGTLSPAVIENLQQCGVNRVSLGVQSFVDLEAASVGRLHKRQTVEEDITHLRAAGIANLNVDLIAGLPHQTAESWEASVAAAVASGVPHISVYMLEVDEDSRLGRELIAGGTKYHAHFVPDEDLTTDFYVAACERLEAAGVRQYEISNFAREGCESQHNLKYWTRQPYLGFGVNAHSMLPAPGAEALENDPLFVGLKAHASTFRQGILPAADAIRFATPDSLEGYLAAKPIEPTRVSLQAALEEFFFLGLRLVRGVSLTEASAIFGSAPVDSLSETIDELAKAGLLAADGDVIRLTSRGRLLSNEVFERFLAVAS